MRYFFYAYLLIFNINILTAQETQSQSRIDEIVVTAEFNDIDAFNISTLHRRVSMVIHTPDPRVRISILTRKVQANQPFWYSIKYSKD